MSQVIMNGKVYTIFEKLPEIQPSLNLVHEEMQRKEKKTREQDWKQMARKGYRKK